MTARGDLVRERHGQISRNEPQPGVEPDVFGRARHRFEAQRRNAAVDEPVGGGSHDCLPDTAALPVGAHGERPHPPFGSRQMRDVERGDLLMLVAPHHRALAGIEQGVAPDQRIELRHADADEPIAAIAVGERVGKHAVQRLDVALGGALGARYAGVRQPRSHRAVPGLQCRRAEYWSRMPCCTGRESGDRDSHSPVPPAAPRES